MKKNLKIVKHRLVWGLSLLVLLAAACQHQGTGQQQPAIEHGDHAAAEYTCPMHPQIVRNEPGTCPICKMDLVKKENAPATQPSDTMKMPGNSARRRHAQGGYEE